MIYLLYSKFKVKIKTKLFKINNNSNYKNLHLEIIINNNY